MTTTRDKQLIQTINHNNNTTAVMLMREFLGPDNQWWPMQPIDASQDSAAIDAFSKSLIGSQQSQITTLTTERDSLQSQLTNLQADYDAKVNDNEAKQVQIDSLTEQVATLTAERDARPTQKQLDILTTQVTELSSRPTQEQLDAANARIAELEAQPVQQVATNFQIRAWLITHNGTQIIEQVKALIAAIPDPVEKLLAEQQWEYANNVFRNNPFVERIGTALGLTTEQLDVAYAEACQIQ